MKKSISYEFNLNFPDDFKDIQVVDYLIEWNIMVKKHKLRKVRELRTNKLNKIFQNDNTRI